MTSPSIEELYAEETADMIAARLPSMCLAFAGVFSAAWLFEYIAHPERMRSYAIVFALELLACAAAVALTRRPRGRRHGVAIVASTCCVLFMLIGSYHVLLHGETEIMALALVYLVTGVTVGIPLGGYGQLPIAVAAALAYLGAVALGAVSVTPVPLTALGLVSIGALSVVGATLLDRYRYASFRRTEELRHANVALAHANEVKNLFLANVSHELRTPLNVVLGYAQLMLDDGFGPLPESMRQPLERMVASSRTLVYLIGDLLDLSRIEAGRLSVNLEPVALAPLFAELSTMVAQSIAHKPVRFIAEDPDGLIVTADHDRLRQVLVNLLSNAAKFTPKGEIRLRAAVSNRTIRIEVVDTGVGIAAADLPHLFEPFHRASNAKEFGGVGIGLSISVRLARAMGGDIAVESEPNSGSRFSLQLHAA
jgi:signal transduction histidine kinase